MNICVKNLQWLCAVQGIMLYLQENVLASYAEAVVNHRIHPSQSVAQVSAVYIHPSPTSLLHMLVCIHSPPLSL